MFGRAGRRHEHQRHAWRRFHILASRDETAVAILEPGRLDAQARRVGHRSDALPADARAPGLEDWIDPSTEPDPAA